jgi:hypothetical protein
MESWWNHDHAGKKEDDDSVLVNGCQKNDQLVSNVQNASSCPVVLESPSTRIKEEKQTFQFLGCLLL